MDTLSSMGLLWLSLSFIFMPSPTGPAPPALRGDMFKTGEPLRDKGSDQECRLWTQSPWAQIPASATHALGDFRQVT